MEEIQVLVNQLFERTSRKRSRSLREWYSFHSSPKGMLGKKHSEESKEKMSSSKLGWKMSKSGRRKLSLAHRGMKPSEETRRKMSLSRLGKKHSEETIEKIIKGIVRASNRRPNGQEVFLRDFLNKYFPKEWKYVGNFKFWIEGKNPDFINVNGKKEIIELFGERWHDKKEEKLRINYFKKFGFDTLVVWGKELKDEKTLLRKLMVFQKGGDLNARGIFD